MINEVVRGFLPDSGDFQNPAKNVTKLAVRLAISKHVGVGKVRQPLACQSLESRYRFESIKSAVLTPNTVAI